MTAPAPRPLPTQATSSPALEFERVSRTFSDGARSVTALHDVTLSIPRGAIFGIVGESGAGKSTLLRMMNALEHPTAGRVRFEGTDLATLTGREINRMRHRIGVVFQSFNLVENLTVRRNVALPLRIQRRASSERVAELLDFVGLRGRAEHYPAQLSGGEKQRVAIARAMVSHPSVLLCDEPTSALDTHTTDEVLSLLQATRAEYGTTIVLVTHELDAVKAICDAAAVFEHGELRETLEVTRPAASKPASYLDHVRAELTQ